MKKIDSMGREELKDMHNRLFERMKNATMQRPNKFENHELALAIESSMNKYVALELVKMAFQDNDYAFDPLKIFQSLYEEIKKCKP